MTVADNTSRNQYTATSGQTVFAYTFEIVDKDDIVVLKNGTTLSEGTNYTVSNVGNDSGGNVTLTVGATTGDVLTLYRDMPYSRTQNYTNSGDFLASEVNSDFDNLWLAGEQTNRSFSQSIRKPITDSDSISMELPAAATRAGRVLTFDSTGAVSTAVLSGITPSTISRQQFTGNGSTTVFTLASDLGVGAGVVIYIDGVYQEEGAYTVSGTTLTFSEAPPTNASIEVVSYKVSDIATGDASSISYLPAGTGAVQTTVQTKLRESVSVEDFGAVGDGVTDDTAAIQAALAAAGSTAFLIFQNKTYIFDGILSLNLIKSDDATLKLKDSATVTGGASDYLVDVVGGAIIQGKITIDANRDNNTVAPATGTIPGVAVRLNGSNHSIDHIKAINSWNNGFNSPIGNTGNVNNSTIGTIEARNCSGGVYLNFQNGNGRVDNIIALSMDAKYTNSNPHAVDIFNGDGIVVESVYIDGVTGTSDAGSVWYSGLTILDVINSTIGSKGVTIKNYTGSQLIPLASSILSAKNTTFSNWHCEKYSENNLIEISGCGTCVFDNVSLIADYGETYTGANPGLTVGIRIADDAVINFSQGRQHFASSNNVFKNIFMENMGTAIEDGGIDNRFENVRVYGSLFAGYVAKYVNIGTGYPSVASPIFGGATLIDCEFSYCNGPGIEINNGARAVNIINCKTIGNGKDSSIATLHLSGIKMLNAATDYSHKIINHNGDDDYATLIKTGLFSAEEGNVFSDTRTFPCTALDGAHFLRAGMRFTLINAAGGTTSIPVRVEHMPYASDLFDVRPITPAASGVISNGASVALTGTFSGTAGSRTITGVGSSLTTEIAGRAYITLGGVIHQVGAITSNTEMTLVQPLGASISGVSGTLHVSDSTASASQQVAYYGSQVDVKGMTFDGNISASPTSGNRIGQREVRLINVPAAGSAVLTLDNAYPEIPYATATVSSSIVDSCSVVRTSKTALTIHNGAAGARDIMVFVEF